MARASNGRVGAAIGKAARSAARRKNAALLAEVRRAHRNSGAKLSRFKANGATGLSQIDPRRDLKKVGNYNAVQLRKYLSELRAFNDRSNSAAKVFVQGAGGTFIPKSQWSAYKKVEANYNRIVDGNSLPGGSTEVNGGGYRIQPPQEPRESTQVTSAEALQTLMDDLSRRSDPAYRDERISKVRENIEKLVEPLGDQDILDKVAGMTDYQLGLLWENTQFASKLALKYEGRSGNEGGLSDRARDKINEDSAEEARDILDRGIRTLPKSAEEAAAARKSRRSKS